MGGLFRFHGPTGVCQHGILGWLEIVDPVYFGGRGQVGGTKSISIL